MFNALKGDPTAARRRAQSGKKKKVEDNEEENFDKNYYANLYGEDDEFYKKWAGPVLIGPLFMAMISILVIVSGQLLLNSDLGVCGYDLACKQFSF
jgi:hypothetical protein